MEQMIEYVAHVREEDGKYSIGLQTLPLSMAIDKAYLRSEIEGLLEEMRSIVEREDVEKESNLDEYLTPLKEKLDFMMLDYDRMRGPSGQALDRLVVDVIEYKVGDIYLDLNK